ncbi:MAG: hypothetical protein COA43_04830 [Robiginitomaculum sp.]|nr:MAG: hypothetical protein COA43_04830 [Robiginitomaculum sp.]
MSNLSYRYDAETLWSSREVVRFFKDEVISLRDEQYRTLSAKITLGKKLRVYFDAVEVQNAALISLKSDKGLAPEQFLQAVLNGIKPLTKSKKSGNSKGKVEGAAMLAFLSDHHPDIAKKILDYAAKETVRVGVPKYEVEFREFTRVLSESCVGEKISTANAGNPINPEGSQGSDHVEKLQSKYDLCPILKWPINEVSDDTLQTIGFERQYSDVWTVFATCEDGWKNFKNLDGADIIFQKRAKSKWHTLNQPYSADKHSYCIDDEGNIVADIRDYGYGYKLGSFFFNQDHILATLFSEYSYGIGSNSRGTLITLHGESEALTWTLKKKAVWEHTSSYRVPSKDIQPIAFRGTNDNKHIIYVDSKNLVVLDGISLFVEGKDNGVQFHVTQKGENQNFWHTCFSANQTHVAISGYSDVIEDTYLGEQHYQTCARLYNLKTGEIDFSFPISNFAAESGFEFSCFMNNQKVIVYSDEDEVIFYDFEAEEVVGKANWRNSSFPNQASFTHPAMQFSKDNRFLIARGQKLATVFFVLDLSKNDGKLMEVVQSTVEEFEYGMSFESRIETISNVVTKFHADN